MKASTSPRRLGRVELKRFKFYRQATNKIVGISDEAAAFLRGFLERHRSGELLEKPWD